MKNLSHFERKILTEITVTHPVTFQEVEAVYNHCLSFDATIYQIENSLKNGKSIVPRRGKKLRTDLEIMADVAPGITDLAAHSAGLKDILNGMKLLRYEFIRIIDNRILEVQCDNVTSPVKKSVILCELKKLKTKI